MIWKKTIYDSLTSCATICNEFATECSNSEDIETWLQRWEKTYSDALKLGLPEVQDNLPLYDFLLAIRHFFSSFFSPQAYIL